jgi:hypothetical protein
MSTGPFAIAIKIAMRVIPTMSGDNQTLRVARKAEKLFTTPPLTNDDPTQDIVFRKSACSQATADDKKCRQFNCLTVMFQSCNCGTG